MIRRLCRWLYRCWRYERHDDYVSAPWLQAFRQTDREGH